MTIEIENIGNENIQIVMMLRSKATNVKWIDNLTHGSIHIFWLIVVLC